MTKVKLGLMREEQAVKSALLFVLAKVIRFYVKACVNWFHSHETIGFTPMKLLVSSLWNY